MAANLMHIRPSVVRVSALPGRQNHDSDRRNNLSPSNWWSPIFGLSSDPDYIDSDRKVGEVDENKEVRSRSQSDLNQKSVRSRFAPGCFTEDKAKQLRVLTKETSTFHDVMYHSAIASRLASDFGNRSDS